jgi:cobalt-precorrin-5B (C1)-methyltransferase
MPESSFDLMSYHAAPRAGYTLPVFACAAAIAALGRLRNSSLPISSVSISLLNPPEDVEIPVEQAARLDQFSALAMTRSDPGDNLDLTRNTPIWAWVTWGDKAQSNPIELYGGEGLGHDVDGNPAIYAYAQRLLRENLSRHLYPAECIRVTIILPEGRSLAERTSNAAFGIVEGLSLLGTSGIAQPLSTPGQLEAYRTELQRKVKASDCLVFCIGENGLDFAQQLGVQESYLVKTANWLGPLLVEAGMQGVDRLLLFGYHGKLIKLAAGIFHTHHHVADGRQEILAAHCALQGMMQAEVQTVFHSATAETALGYLQQMSDPAPNNWVSRVYGAIANEIDRRSSDYIYKHCQRRVLVGSVLFNRQRQIIVRSDLGGTLLTQVC